MFWSFIYFIFIFLKRRPSPLNRVERAFVFQIQKREIKVTALYKQQLRHYSFKLIYIFMLLNRRT